MKIIIAGSRHFIDYKTLRSVCDDFIQTLSLTDIEIVSGTARGADLLGERYAEERGYRITRFAPDWDKFGKSAGPIRNKQMAEYSDALIAFWDGKSRGTNSMISLANSNNLKVYIFNIK